MRLSIPLTIVVVFVTSATAVATPVTITITGKYPATIVGTAAPYSSQDFRFEFLTDLNPVPDRVENTTAFVITPSVDYYVGGAFFGTFTTRLVGWYYYRSQDYKGIDLRLNNWIGIDWYQVIIPFPVVGFTGPVSAPTLTLISLANLEAFFFARGAARLPGHFVASAVTYSASTVPEPSTLALLAIGIVGLAGWRMRWQ